MSGTERLSPWTQGPSRVPQSPRGWLPDALIAIVVLAIGVFEMLDLTWGYYAEDAWRVLPVVIGTALSVLLARHLPGAALALVWLSCVLQVVLGLPVLLVQLSVAVVAFGTARWGSRLTVLASLLSMPAAGFAFLLVIETGLLEQLVLNGRAGSSVLSLSYYDSSRPFTVVLVGLAAGALVVPWLLGMVLRFAERARASRVSQVAAEQDAERAHRETDQAQEIAALREDQARMARDVHDVVGHSLAVILAQAESAQFLEGEERLKETLATIAGAARTSLQDVRQVLSATPTAPQADGVESLIEGVRASGFAVEARELGAPQPLPPELATVAHRVLQEMLTNAMKHGRRDAPIGVERHWPDGRWERELRIEVRNMVDAGGAAAVDGRTADDVEETRPLTVARTEPLLSDPATAGTGVDGMRRRLEAVGGRLDVRRRDDPAGGAASYTATAWVPVRAGAGA